MIVLCGFGPGESSDLTSIMSVFSLKDKKRRISLGRIYVTGRRRSNKVYIFLIRTTTKVDLAMSVCLAIYTSVRLSKMFGQRFSETIRATDSKFCIVMQFMCTQNAISPNRFPSGWVKIKFMLETSIFAKIFR